MFEQDKKKFLKKKPSQKKYSLLADFKSILKNNTLERSVRKIFEARRELANVNKTMMISKKQTQIFERIAVLESLVTINDSKGKSSGFLRWRIKNLLILSESLSQKHSLNQGYKTIVELRKLKKLQHFNKMRN